MKDKERANTFFKILENFKNKKENLLNNNLFVKIFTSTIIPYPSNVIEIKSSEQKFENLMKNMDLKALESFKFLYSFIN